MSKATAFKEIKPVQRAQEVRQQLVAAIERGDYGPGDRLPSERELGESFGVSRVSVREAMRGLEAVGMVNVIHGKGCFVSESPGQRYRGPFAGWLEMHREQVLELMKVRGALDELAAEEAAKRDMSGREQVKDAHAAFAAVAAAKPPSVDDLVNADIQYHIAVASASGSELLLDLLTELNEHFTESRTFILAAEGRVEASLREHAEMTDAILDGNPRKARSAAARHIQSVTRQLAEGGLAPSAKAAGEQR